MNFLIQNEIGWIVAIQSLGGWLESPMKFFTFWDYQHILFIVLPLIYWCVDTQLGFRLAIILATSDYLNGVFKLLFTTPRPYWINAQVKFFPSKHSFGISNNETSFGLPSGHAQNASALWGTMAVWLNKRWVWLVALILTFFIGFSRIYLGVHFVRDVIAGWLIAYAILFVFLRFWDQVAPWLKTKTLAQQMLIAFATSLILIAIGAWTAACLDKYVFPQEWKNNALRAGPLPNPVSIENILTACGSLFGLAAGAAWTAYRGGYQASGSIQQRSVRYLVGMLIVMMLWFGLEKAFPHGRTWIPMILRYIRFSLIGLWIIAGAPWLFFNLKLSDSFNEPDRPTTINAVNEKLASPEG
jgi:membrane-associated phospholipid phosphatase